MRLKLCTYNVLHPIHEVNYAPESPVLQKYSSDESRHADIITQLQNIVDGTTICCLQEVPDTLLDKLVKKFTTHAFCILTHERIPTLQKPTTFVSDNVRESVVTMVPVNLLLESYSIPFDNSKGCVVTKIAGDKKTFSVYNVHLPYNASKNEALRKISLDIEDKFYIVAGDFNTGRRYITKVLQATGFAEATCCYLKEYTRTSVENGKREYSQPDHIINNMGQKDGSVVMNDDTSDHRLVYAWFDC